MEIIAVSQNSFKIKSRNTSFIVNPVKNDADVILATHVPSDYSQFEGKLVISGPGEFEVAGVSIKCESTPEGLAFTLLEENQTLLILPSAKNAKTEESEGVTATVVILDSKLDGALNITSDVVAVVAPAEFLPQDMSGIKKIDKVNLKKTDEYKGSIVYLSK